MRVDARSRSAVPSAAPAFPDQTPSRSFQTDTTFLFQCVCDETPVAQCPGGSAGCAVEPRTSIGNSIRATASDFQGPAVVQVTRDRPADNDHTAERSSVRQ